MTTSILYRYNNKEINNISEEMKDSLIWLLHEKQPPQRGIYITRKTHIPTKGTYIAYILEALLIWVFIEGLIEVLILNT